MTRSLFSILLLGTALGGCHRDPVRELVEQHPASAAAAAACLDRSRKLPAHACHIVAERTCDGVLREPKPNDLECGDALLLARLHAPERLPELADKCCRSGGLATDVEAACRIARSAR